MPLQWVKRKKYFLHLNINIHILGQFKKIVFISFNNGLDWTQFNMTK